LYKLHLVGYVKYTRNWILWNIPSYYKTLPKILLWVFIAV